MLFSFENRTVDVYFDFFRSVLQKWIFKVFLCFIFLNIQPKTAWLTIPVKYSLFVRQLLLKFTCKIKIFKKIFTIFMNFPLKSAWLTIPEEFNHCPTIFSILSTFRTVLSVQPRMVDVYFDFSKYSKIVRQHLILIKEFILSFIVFF